MNLRPNWHRRFQDALKMLKELGTPLAKKALKIIDRGEVSIKSFSQVTRKDYIELHDEYYANQNHPKEKKQYPPSNRFVKSMTEVWNGAIYENRIYINSDIESVRKIAKIIVHEVNHFIND